jgi:hypothetical protein
MPRRTFSETEETPVAGASVYEVALAHHKKPSGGHCLRLYVHMRAGVALIDSVETEGRLLSERDVDLLLATARDAIMRELITTNGIQLTMDADG